MGYWGGGYTSNPSTTYVSIVTKVDFSTDTRTSSPGLSAARGNNLAATGNSTHGYFGGGTIPGSVSTVDKITYASNTTAAVPSAN